jgi:CheY-like chemotaxis protein
LGCEPPRLLIVDDKPASLEIMEARLARQGYEIVTATDGDTALGAQSAAHCPLVPPADAAPPHANCPKPPENRLTERRSDRRGSPEAAGGAGTAADLLDRDEPKVRLRFENQKC